MSIGVRELTVLGEFKPFGLVAEELDGKVLDDDDVTEEYQYFLFHPDVAREGGGPGAADAYASLDFSFPSPSSDDGDHEIFIRGNRLEAESYLDLYITYMSSLFLLGSMLISEAYIWEVFYVIIWSTGSRVHKRYTSEKKIVMACWCRMEAIADALLCVLQIDTLSIYGASGEVVCIPLPFAIASIFPLPFGLLLQKATDGNP